MVAVLIDQRRQCLLALAKSLQGIDRLLVHELSGHAATQLLQRLDKLGLIGRIGRADIVQNFALICVLCPAVVPELHMYPLVEQIAEELPLLGFIRDFFELLEGNGNSDLSLQVG